MKTREVTVVTGASAGIGKELATIAAERGRDLVLVARSADKLEALAASLGERHGVEATPIPLDLGEPAAPEVLFRALAERDLEADTLINNAGYGNHGPFHESASDVELGMVQLNVTALTHLTHLALPKMVSRGRGRILNIASTAAFQPGPLMAVYYATKAYVLSFSEAIAEELSGTGVTVTAFCPGLVRTDFIARANMERANLVRFGAAEPRAVAEAGYRAMEEGRVVHIPGLKNKLGAFSVRLGPRAVVRSVTKRLNQAKD